MTNDDTIRYGPTDTTARYYGGILFDTVKYDGAIRLDIRREDRYNGEAMGRYDE
jgi:hypothetical protein